MGRYANEARRHAERIEHYYKHAGTTGYAQAEPHYSKLSGLIGRAARSKNDKNDAVIVQCIRDSCTQMMQDMKRLQEEHTQQEKGEGQSLG